VILLKDVIQLGVTKLKEAKSKIMNRPSKSKGKMYDKFFVYIPADVVKDSSFPFEPGQPVIVKISQGRLVIEKA
jgi:hypothetical protein